MRLVQAIGYKESSARPSTLTARSEGDQPGPGQVAANGYRDRDRVAMFQAPDDGVPVSGGLLHARQAREDLRPDSEALVG